MDPRILVEPSVVPQNVAVLGMLLLASALLRLGFNNVMYRAFALLLIFRALVMLTASWYGTMLVSVPEEFGGIGDTRTAIVFALVEPYFVLPMPFLILWFASVYPRRRGFFGTHPAGPWVLILGALTLELLYFFDHSLFWERTTATLSREGVSWSSPIYLATGPLSLSLGFMYLGLAILGLVFTVDYIRLPPGPRKSGIIVVAFAFVLNSLFDASYATATLLRGASETIELIQWLILLAWVPCIIAMVALIVHDFREPDLAVHRHIKKGMLLAILPVASGFFMVFTPHLREPALVLTGFWRLWLPALVTYALVRHQLFDIDLKIKFALKQSTLAGIALVGFLTFSEILEAIITSSDALSRQMSERASDIAGLGIAVGLTYALKPVQNLAQRVTDKAMPNVADTEDYLMNKRLEVYRATLEGALEDGDLTERERVLLEGLRLRLGLDDKVTDSVEADVRKAFRGRTIAA